MAHPYGSFNRNPRESNIFRSSSVSTGLNSLNPMGVGGMQNREQHNFYGSAMDMSIVGNGMHSNRASLLPSSTPLARKFNEVANSSVSHPNGHYQSSQASVGQSGYPRESQMGRPTASISGMSSFADRPSVAAPFTTFSQHSALTKDPRPLDSAEFRRNAAANLFQFLQRHDFESKVPTGKYALTEKALNPVSQKTFENVFEFLLKILFGENYSLKDKKFEAEVMLYANKLSYPFASSLKPNVVKGPYVQGAASVVCGFLDWLREEVEAWEALTSSANKDALEPGQQTLYHRGEEGVGPNGKNIDNVFHNARLDFMRELYLRSQNPSDEDIYIADIMERFKERLHPCIDTSVDVEALQAELLERGGRLQETLRNYESLDMIRARLEATEARIAQSKKDDNEQKSIINRAEHDLMKLATDEKKIEQDNQQLSKQMEDVQKQIRRQKISKEEHQEKLAKQEELRGQIRTASEELENIGKLVAKRKQNQQRSCAKLQDSVQVLKLGLVQMDDTASLDKLSDYTADQDINKYMTDAKAEVSRVILRLRSRAEELRATIHKARNELAELEKKREPLHASIVKAAETEKTLQLAIETFNRVQDTSEAAKKLEEKKRVLFVEQQTANSELDAAKADCRKSEQRYNQYAKGQKKIKDALALRKAADIRLRTEHVEKQHSRSAHLDGILAGIENEGDAAKEAVSSLERTMLDAMQGRE